MNHKEYNGYYNYETWVVALWIDNDEGQESYWMGGAAEALENTEDQDGEHNIDKAVSELEDLLKEQHEQDLPELTGFAADLLNAAMSEVNWREIAQKLVNDVIEDSK